MIDLSRGRGVAGWALAWALGVGLLLAAGCDDEEEGEPSPDAAAQTDGAVSDAGPQPDAAPGPDATPGPDAGPRPDLGPAGPAAHVRGARLNWTQGPAGRGAQRFEMTGDGVRLTGGRITP